MKSVLISKFIYHKFNNNFKKKILYLGEFLMSLDTTRILTIVIQTIMAIVFIYLGYLIVKRDKKRLNIIFSSFYFFAFIATVFNWTYAFLNPHLNDIVLYVVLYLNYVTNFFYFTSLGFLLAFSLIIYKSEKIFNAAKQVLYLVVYIGGLGVLMFLFINIPGMGVEFHKANSSSPYWTLPFFLLVFLALTVGSIGPTIYILYKTFKQFDDPELKKKYRYFSIGFVEISAFAYLIAIANFLKDVSSLFPTIALLLGSIFVITGAYLLYIGVGKQISK